MNAQMMKNLQALDTAYMLYVNQMSYMEQLKFQTRPEVYDWKRVMGDDGIRVWKKENEIDTYHLTVVVPRNEAKLLEKYQKLQKCHYCLFAPTLNQVSVFNRNLQAKLIEIKPTYDNVTVDVLKLCPDVVGLIGEFVGLDALKAESNENKFKNFRKTVDMELLKNKKNLLDCVTKPQMRELLHQMIQLSKYDEIMKGITYWYAGNSCTPSHNCIYSDAGKGDCFNGLISMGQGQRTLNRNLLNMKMCILDLVNRVLIKKTKRTFNWEVGMNMEME